MTGTRPGAVIVGTGGERITGYVRAMGELPDFDAVYRGESVMTGITEVPWNIGEPQPAIAALIDGGRVSSPVLDAGCGVGVTTRALVRGGFDVTGVDASATAIEQARRDAEREGVDADFAVADLTALTGYDDRFATVIDSAVLHAVDADRQTDYVAALARACRPGAALHVLVFTDDVPMPDDRTGVNGVSEPRLRALVEPSFTVESIEPSTIAARIPAHVMPGVARDDADRALLPAFRMTAHRA